MSYHGESSMKYISQKSFFLNGCWIPGYFDTKFIVVALIEPILYNFEDLKIANFLNPEQVYFFVTRVICHK